MYSLRRFAARLSGLARAMVKDLAAEHDACLRPVQLRRTDIDTGHVEQVLIPCGHTLASVCQSCAERARILRAAQRREGWHLDHEPVIDPDPATQDQRATVTDRAEVQADRDALAGQGLDTGDLDERISELDQQITETGLRGQVLPARPRRHRSTRRRQDAAPLRRITLHESRHTTLTLMEHAGVPISIISKWAGHYDSAFTQKTYVHASDDDLQRGQAALAKIHKIA
jgi:hypothetical protein